jgi:hypothetical protein
MLHALVEGFPQSSRRTVQSVAVSTRGDRAFEGATRAD